MSILSWISNLITPISNTIDEFHFSGEEKGALEIKKAELKQQLVVIQADLQTKFIELESKALDTNARLVEAESKSDSWFTRTYRPLIITGMFLLLCASSFGLLKFALPDVFLQVFGVAFGVTSAGRSLEKFKSLGS